MQQREHGEPPRNIVLLHGGPGAAGEVEPVGQRLASMGHGVLEPFQTARSVTGQIAELRETIAQSGTAPVTLIGWSWGAWLAMMVAAEHPDLVAHLVMVGSGPLDPADGDATRLNRAARLTLADQAELASLEDSLDDPDNVARMIAIYDRIDNYALDHSPPTPVQYDGHIAVSVWAEAAAMRRKGALLDHLARIRCPITAIHGDHDPHPAEGVRAPLARVQPHAEFILLPRCGHKPWRETYASDAFYAVLARIIQA